MRLIRHYLFKLYYVCMALLWATLIFIAVILPYRWRQYLTSFWADSIIWGIRIICGVHWQVTGREHIPDGPCLLVLNHQSNWETFFTTMLKRKMVSVLKKEIINVPYVGWAMRLLRPIALDRAQPRKAMATLMNEGKKRVADGYSLSIFPEGKRSPVNAPRPFKMGAGRLAAELGIPVVPIAHNAGIYWPVHGIIRPGIIKVVIGEAIDTQGVSPKQINQQVETWITDTRNRILQA